MNRYVDAEWLIKESMPLSFSVQKWVNEVQIMTAPSIDIVRCKECKHRPIKEDVNGEDYGFNLIEPTEDDDRCPCLVDDGWYSLMPKDDFYCGFGEREDK